MQLTAKAFRRLEAASHNISFLTDPLRSNKADGVTEYPIGVWKLPIRAAIALDWLLNESRKGSSLRRSANNSSLTGSLRSR
jgi:hypothetical protein